MKRCAERPEFFAKILYLDRCGDGRYAFLPHRCEHIPAKGRNSFRRSDEADRICSGTPVKPYPWPLGNRHFIEPPTPTPAVISSVGAKH